MRDRGQRFMPYPAKAIANEFLELAARDGKKLTPMQLQKLVYFAHGWYLAITGEPLINEHVEAWQWGPVIPSLYNEFKRFGNQPITDLSRVVKVSGGKVGYVPLRLEDPDNPQKAEFARQLINRVWQIYGKFTASQLSEMTHAPDSPWSQTPNKEIRGTDIPEELIKTYFQRLAREDERRQPHHAQPGR